MSENSFYRQFVQFFERFGHMLSRLILTLLYFIFVTPAGIVISLFGDPLKMKKPANSNWRNVEVDMADKKRARSQI
jgi:hypothetical protein